MNTPPGPKGMPLLGNAPALRQGFLGFLSGISAYGDVSSFTVGPERGYILKHPDDIRRVLVTEAEHFRKDPADTTQLSRALGWGLVTIDGERHRRQRKLEQPAFHTTRISAYAETMTDYTLRMLQSWQSGDPVDLYVAMHTLTRNVVLKTLFDFEIGESDTGEAIHHAIADLQHYITRLSQLMIPIPPWVPIPWNTRIIKARQKLDNLIQEIIQERRKTDEDRGDLLSMLLQSHNEDDGSAMTDEQVRDECVTLFAAGHETTANALTWTFYLLMQNPDALAKLQDELATVLQGRTPQLSDLRSLPYTEMVIKESMRIYPPVWMLTLRQSLTDTEFGGYTLPKGGTFVLSPYLVHHDARWWPEPEKFQPERFQNEKDVPKFAYFPFGGGARVCIGQSFAMMEAALILATIAPRFEFDLAPGYELVLRPEITLSPKNGLPVTIHERVADPV